MCDTKLHRTKQFGAYLLLKELWVTLLNKVNNLCKALGKLLKILLIKENLMAVKRLCTVGTINFARLGNCQKVVTASSCLNIKEVGPATSLNRLGENLIAIIFSLKLVC